MQSAKRFSRCAIAGVAVAALVTGCGGSGGGADSAVFPSRASSAGGGDGSSNPHALLAASVDKTEAARNAKLHIEVKASSAGKSVAFGGDGVVDFAAKKFQLSLTLPAEAGLSGTIEERVIGQAFYLKLPVAATSATGGKPWIKLDASQLGSGGSSSLGSFGQDPTQFLSTLRSVSDSITKVGTEEIRGVRTTHYRAQIDLTKAAAASGTASTSIEQYKKLLGSSTLPEDVYLDDNGVARRFAVSINPATASTGAAATGAFSTTVDLYDFGSTDTSGIVAPPADEVGSLPAGLGGGLFG